jgi:pimeloyl-ACP methyl ester carboxylesterase
MQGAYLDSIIAATRGRKKQEKSLRAENMKLVATQAGMLRILDTGEHNKHPLIVVPDGPCVIEHYADLIELLLPDFRVICFDLPGFGFSYPAFRYDFSVSQTAEAVVEIMDLLDISDASLSFTCANGFVALCLAKNYPTRVSHLVLGQTPSFQLMRQWNEKIIPKILHIPYVGQSIAAGFARKISSGWYNSALPSNSEHKPQFVECADRALKSGGCFCLASLVQGLNRTQDSEISEISVPTLLIYGDKDRSHRHTDFTSLRDHVSKAEVIEFQGCGHFPDLERPQEYAKHIKQFVGMAA